MNIEFAKAESHEATIGPLDVPGEKKDREAEKHRGRKKRKLNRLL